MRCKCEMLASSLGGVSQQMAGSLGLEKRVGRWRQGKGGTEHGVTLDSQAQGERPVERDPGNH